MNFRMICSYKMNLKDGNKRVKTIQRHNIVTARNRCIKHYRPRCVLNVYMLVIQSTVGANERRLNLKWKRWLNDMALTGFDIRKM